VLGRKFGDILVHDAKVSGTHAALEFRGGGFHLQDLGSANGTFIGDSRVKEALLDESEEARIGVSGFRIRIDPALAERLRATRPVEAVPAEGGLTDLLDREFLGAGSGGAPDPTQSMQSGAADVSLLFTVHTGPDQGKRLAVQGASAVIGRGSADVALKDPDVSRKHAVVEHDATGQVILRDLASRNGTFVNDRRVANCVLNRGDRVRVGSTILVFQGFGG
jgi:pSer/pThr/pTyr-binding forkhead associated (FHA) protein